MRHALLALLIPITVATTGCCTTVGAFVGYSATSSSKHKNIDPQTSDDRKFAGGLVGGVVGAVIDGLLLTSMLSSSSEHTLVN